MVKLINLTLGVISGYSIICSKKVVTLGPRDYNHDIMSMKDH